jgi:CRP-like cAMP-binding protein
MTKQIEQSGRPDPRANDFLAKLQRDDFDALMLKSKIVSLKLRKLILRQDEPVDAVYFPLTCMFSVLVTNEGEPQVEMATIGKEGVVGASEALQNQGAVGLNLIQIPGDAVRIDATSFRNLANDGTAMQQLIYQHMYALLRQVLYGAACNRIHSMEERCARWLLMTHDRAGRNTFPITQEFLSHMLGVRRATVNVATGMLRKAGFIQYVRGKLTIIDRPGLESASCGCYEAILKVYSSLVPEPCSHERSS